MAIWSKHHHPKRVLTKEERARLVGAIQAAERGTSGEIHVHIERRCPGDPLERARRLFAELHLAATARRNGVLVYVALVDRRFAIFGDEGIHQAMGEEWWHALRDVMASHFRERRFAEGLCAVVEKIGAALHDAFPAGPDDVNELSNEPTFGE